MAFDYRWCRSRDLIEGQFSTFNNDTSFIAFGPESQRLAIMEGVRLREIE